MALLADSEYNADRVVGAKEIRGADPGYFPAGDPLLLDRDRLADDQGSTTVSRPSSRGGSCSNGSS